MPESWNTRYPYGIAPPGEAHIGLDEDGAEAAIIDATHMQDGERVYLYPGIMIRDADVQWIPGLTGTGSQQSISHALGYVPAAVIPIIKSVVVGGTTATGTHTESVVRVTCSLALPYGVLVIGRSNPG